MPVIKAANLVRRRGDQEALPVIKRIDKPHEPPGCRLVSVTQPRDAGQYQPGEPSGDGKIVARRQRRLAQ